MEPVNFFSIASQQNRWLAVRQSVVAQNVANVNTPGFKAMDVEPFEAILNETGMAMKRTQANHLNAVRHRCAATGDDGEGRLGRRCIRATASFSKSR